MLLILRPRKMKKARESLPASKVQAELQKLLAGHQAGLPFSPAKLVNVQLYPATSFAHLCRISHTSFCSFLRAFFLEAEAPKLLPELRQSITGRSRPWRDGKWQDDPNRPAPGLASFEGMLYLHNFRLWAMVYIAKVILFAAYQFEQANQTPPAGIPSSPSLLWTILKKLSSS